MSAPQSWTTEDVRAVARGAGFVESGPNAFGVETFTGLSDYVVTVHPDGAVYCGRARADLVISAAWRCTPEGAVACLLRWTMPDFTAWCDFLE